jgi:hypothetical protein
VRAREGQLEAFQQTWAREQRELTAQVTHSGGAVVLQCCNSVVTVALQWSFSGVRGPGTERNDSTSNQSSCIPCLSDHLVPLPLLCVENHIFSYCLGAGEKCTTYGCNESTAKHDCGVPTGVTNAACATGKVLSPRCCSGGAVVVQGCYCCVTRVV